MSGERSNTALRADFVEMLGLLFTYATRTGYRLIITAVYRTPEEQKALFDRGLTKLDGFIKKSKHQLWRAVDLCIIDAESRPQWEHDGYKALGEYWKSIGGTWGGDWASLNDVYHFELQSEKERFIR